MKTMIDVKHVGIVKSMRHVATRASTGPENLPHLNLYVHQMNLYKLKKEKKAMLYRLEEIDKQIVHIQKKINSLRPNVMSAFEPERKRRRKKGNSGSGDGRKRIVKKLRVDF